MKRTPHYLMSFYQRGDLYRASEDLMRMTTIDSQLIDLSQITGDGVLTGWNIYKTKDLDPSAGDLDISVSVGAGFISNLYQVSLGIKTGTVIDNSKNFIYLQTSAFNNPGGFPIEVQGPLSAPPADATFIDTVAPSAPTNFDAQPIEYDIVNLVWDANTEADVVSYEIQRSLNVSFSPFVIVGNPTVNGTNINPLQDTGLTGGTDYYYRIRATDRSGNQSGWSLLPSSFVTTLPDVRVASEVTSLKVLGGDGELSISFLPSDTNNFLSYRVNVDRLNSDGSIDVPSVYVVENPTSLYYQATGLLNNRKYRITVQTRAISNGIDPLGNLSSGVIAEVSTSKSSAPLNVTAISTTSGSGNIQFDWVASTSPTSSPSLSVSGYKTKYLIIPIIDNKEALPIDVGLATSFTVYGYNEILSVGFGPTKKFKERTYYLFKICTEDGFGNRSSGTYAIGTILTTTLPNKPRAFFATAGDKQALLQWNHSTSEGVVGYEISYDQGFGFSPPISVSYVTDYLLTGLTNDLVTTARIKAKNDAGLLSIDYVNTVFTPTEDLATPPIPLHVRLTASDSQISMTWEDIDRPDITKYIIQKILINAPANFPQNINPEILEEYYLDVGLTSQFIDIGVPLPLENGKQYGYAVATVRTNPSGREIQGEFSSIYYVSPNEGLNSGPDRLLAPTNATAVLDTPNNQIILTWDFTFHDMVYNVVTGKWEYPIGDGPTAFNIFRSQHPLSGYQLIATIDAGDREYKDTNLVGGTKYYYIIAAMRDNVSIIVDTGSIEPAHSILLGSVTARSGNIIEISHDQRVVLMLQSTIEEETKRKLLEHRHSVGATNTIDMTAQSSITMVEANTLRTECFSGANFTCSSTLNPEYIPIYKNAIIASQTNTSQTVVNTIQSPEGIPISGASTSYGVNASYINYDTNTVYLIDPRLIVWNPPYVGDYQVLINNAKPTVPFSINHDINAIIFQTPLKDTDVVRLDGQGLTFYIPAKINRDYFGYDIFINGIKTDTVQVSEISQTITLSTPLDMTTQPSVIAKLDPVIPDYGTQNGPRQISLSPNIILNDFIPQGLSVYRSQSGAFDSGDTVFVLVNGERTILDHYVDFELKSIVFTSPLPINTNVSLEIRNAEETQNELPESKITAGIDGSQIKTGTLLEAQLPNISHEGRVRERAYPIFSTLATSNSYEYSSDALVGTGTTAYDFHIFEDGNYILGTSNGILKTFLTPGFLISSRDDLIVNSSTPVGGGINFGKDAILEAALIASENSGRVYGSLSFPALMLSSTTQDIELQNPSICILDNGNVFMSGGLGSKACFNYNPSTQSAVEAPSMSIERVYHTCIKLADGRVMICGGVKDTPSSCVCLTQTEFDNLDKTDGIIGSWFLKSAEMYDISLNIWTSLPDMDVKKMNHAAVVVNLNDATSKVLVTGGKRSYRLSPVDFLSSSVISCVNILFCDPEGADIKLDQMIGSSQLFDPVTLTWSPAKSMIYPGETCGAKSDNENVAITTSKSRQIYNYITDKWQTSSGQCDVSTVGIVNEEVNGPVKRFLRDNLDRVLCSTRKDIYYSEDKGRSWVKMNGLDAIGVIHSICQSSNNTLFAATDLGVYEIENNIGLIWLQGGLIGEGTTETFEVIPMETSILAGTEIGVYLTSDNGQSWTELTDIPNVTSIFYVGDGLVYAISNKDLYKSSSYGSVGTWEKVGSYEFIDVNSKIAIRMPFEIFISSGQGLYRSIDGTTFSLAQFDFNKDSAKNNVQSIRMIESDLYVSFDNEIFVLDPSGNVYLLSGFTGNVPTVMVNNQVLRGGYQYDIKNNKIIFETKRFSDDVVKMTSNYSLYQLNGGWYSQNPNASLQVYVNQITQPDSAFIYDARLGQFSFKTQLQNYDEVTVSIAGTTLKDGGMYFHSELEDKLEKEKGLPLSLGRDFTGNILQMGLSIEHNFLERGEERNQYYCLQTSLVDRPFTSFLPNSDFFILGRKEFDRFNSTIDYKIEAQQTLFGNAVLVPLTGLSYSTSEYWIGADSGVFIVNPTALFALEETVQIESDQNSVRDLNFFSTDVFAATKNGIFRMFKQSGKTVYEKNPMQGLPDQVYTVNSLNNYLMVGTNDGMYFSTSLETPSYTIWYRASHIPNNGQPVELVLDGKVDATIVVEGTAYSFVGSDLFISNDAKIWKRVFSFPATANPNDAVRVSKMVFFGGKLYVATNKGVYDDDGSVKSDQVVFKTNIINGTSEDSIINMNYIAADGDVLYAAANDNNLFRLKNQIWTKELISEAKSIHLVDLISGTVMAVENNVIFTE